MKNLYVGRIYHVVFTDHALNSDSILCEVFGRLISYTKDAYIFSHWEPLSDDEELNENNREFCSIIKNAVKRIYELKPKERQKKANKIIKGKHRKIKSCSGNIYKSEE
jgi:hypothetical protein